MTDLSRRVQHYGFRYDYSAPGNGRHDPAPALSTLGFTVIGERLSPFFDGAMPEQCIVNEYRPGQGIGMHADHSSFGHVVVVAVARRRLDDELPAPFGPPLRPRRAGVRRGGPAAAPIRARPARTRQERLDARNRSRRQRQPRRDASLCDLQDLAVVTSAAVFVRTPGKAPGHPPGAPGCTESTPPPTRTGPRRDTLRPSGRGSRDFHCRFRPCRKQGPRPSGRRRGRTAKERW